MKFAIANQFLMIADQAGADYNAILHAIRHDYPRAADLPGPGFAAGPCLLKDTMQLASFTSDHFPMGQSAMQINEGLPAYIVDAMSHRFGGLNGKTVGILGMAFKAESDDVRASLNGRLSGIGERVEELPDRVQLYANDGEECLAQVHARGVLIESALVRRATLEDVFLRLTGRSLID